MTGMLYYLAKYPEINAKLKKEIRSAFKSPADINLQSCSELQYLNACLEETLRIYPPIKIGFPRITPAQGAVLDGQFVPGEVCFSLRAFVEDYADLHQTIVYVCQFASNWYPDNWKNPEEFIPERWYSPEYASDKKSSRQPFSCGPRNCIGISFAYHEMRLIMAELLFSFDLELCKESDGWAEDQRTFVLNEKVPLWMKLKPVE
jgi:cytochrome P450